MTYLHIKKNLILVSALAVSPIVVATPEDAAPAPVQDPSLATAPATSEGRAPGSADTDAARMAQAPDHKTAKGVFMDVNIGTLGVGMNVGYEFNRHLKLRIRGSYLAADYDETWSEGSWETMPLDGKFEFDGSSVGLLLDYHPFGGCFHLTGGLNFSGMKADAKATMKNETGLQGLSGEYEFGGTTYRVTGGDEAQVKGRYEWNRVQPYLGIGWSSDGEGDRSFYFSCDIGVNFIGKGSLSVSHSGADIQVKGPDGQFRSSGDIDALLEASLREEGKDFFDIADKIIVYPVIQLGVGGRF